MKLRTALVLAFLAHVGVGTGVLHAHTGGPVAPDEIWRAWASEPWILLVLGAAAWMYAQGAKRVWSRAGVGRGIRRWRFACYVAGLGTLFLALLSPLDALGGTLFSAHMVQHELLIVVAAPLLILGAPGIAFAWALPTRWRTVLPRVWSAPAARASWRILSHPISAWSLHAAAIAVWHVPALYEATVVNRGVHIAQHASFFLTALLFWWVILRPGFERRMNRGFTIFYLFAITIYGSALGALLTFSSSAWYPIYADRAPIWGLTPLEDQQLGGLIMWIPFGTVYLIAALAIFGFWLRAMSSAEEAQRMGRTAASVASMPPRPFTPGS